MTVSELIKALQEMPQDAVVHLIVDGGFTGNFVVVNSGDTVELDHDEYYARKVY